MARAGGGDRIRSRPTRAAGALVILVDGHAAAYLRRGERELLLFLPEAEPSRSRIGREVARMLLHLAATREGRRGMLIGEINGTRPPRIPQHACSSRKVLRRPPWAFRSARNDSARADMDHLICWVQQEPASTPLASALRRLAMEVNAWLRPRHNKSEET